jgi:hypothetical protein
MLKHAAMCALLFLSVAGNGVPQGSYTVHNGYIKAQKYLEMNSEQQEIYVMAVLDGIYLAPVFGAPEGGKVLMHIARCADGMSGSIQVAAIVLKQVKEHPEHWNQSLRDEVYTALLQACT